MMRKSVDIVVPLYNEAQSCARFHADLKAAITALPYDVRVIYINDGSTDGTAEVLANLAASDPAVHVIELSRNFGHQAALTAGLDAADADAVVMMDGDGQHSPALIPEMLRLHEAGFDVVQTQRLDPPGSITAFKRFSAAAFYTALNRLGEMDIGVGVADFRLISREVLHALRQIPEYHRFVRGMVSWLGFRRVVLPFEPLPRHAGKSKYSLRKMVRLAGDGLFSFSLVPLRVGLLLGLLMLLLACAEVFYVASFFLSGRARELVPGWSSIIIMLTVSSGVTMVLLGFIGIYIGMIFQQVKGRPIYIARSSAPVPSRNRNQ